MYSSQNVDIPTNLCKHIATSLTQKIIEIVQGYCPEDAEETRTTSTHDHASILTGGTSSSADISATNNHSASHQPNVLSEIVPEQSPAPTREVVHSKEAELQASYSGCPKKVLSQMLKTRKLPCSAPLKEVMIQRLIAFDMAQIGALPDTPQPPQLPPPQILPDTPRPAFMDLTNISIPRTNPPRTPRRTVNKEVATPLRLSLSAPTITHLPQTPSQSQLLR